MKQILKWAAIGAVALVVIVVGISLAVGGGSKAKPVTRAASPATTTASPSTSSPEVAAASPQPDGTFQGACDYTLGDSPSTGTADAIGDIDATNTGNVGIVVKLTITWPQEGYSPIKQVKTVRIGYGGEKDVQFHRPLTGTELDRLQSYQLGHGGSGDGCTYHGEMTGTFGAAR